MLNHLLSFGIYPGRRGTPLRKEMKKKGEQKQQSKTKRQQKKTKPPTKIFHIENSHKKKKNYKN